MTPTFPTARMQLLVLILCLFLGACACELVDRVPL